MSFSYKDWYNKNKIKLARRKALRYKKDAKYRRSIRIRTLDHYHKHLKKSGIPDRQVVKTDHERYFTIGKIARIVARNTWTIRGYHKDGIIPEVTHYDNRGWRLYTREQATILQLVFRKFDRGDLKSLREVKKEIAAQWK